MTKLALDYSARSLQDQKSITMTYYYFHTRKMPISHFSFLISQIELWIPQVCDAIVAEIRFEANQIHCVCLCLFELFSKTFALHVSVETRRISAKRRNTIDEA